MHDSNPLAPAVEVAAPGIAPLQSPSSTAGLSARLRFRPCVPGCIALAVAVFLWGFGYKLSLYQTHLLTPSRESVAKLWVDHGNGSIVAAIAQQVQTHRISASQLLAPPIFSHQRGECAVEGIVSSQVGGAGASRTLVALRSPPSSDFCLS